MITTEKIGINQKEIAWVEIEDFIDLGLKDVKEEKLYDFDEVFDEIESLYNNA